MTAATPHYPIDVHKRQIVRELFIDTADDNYITARWCFIEQLNVDYFWLAVHALEKYMKAVLLLNGKSSRDFRHNIVELYEHVKSFASEFLPESLKRPIELGSNHRWIDESPEKFLQRLYNNGNPDNRYQIFGFLRYYDDLVKVDLMSFALRRLCVPFDGSIFGGNQTYRNMLIKQPKQCKIPNGKLEKTVDGKRGDRLRELLLNCNFPFAPDDFQHSDLQIGMASYNPVLGRLILEPLKQSSNSNDAALSVELCNWVLTNIKVPGDVKSQLCSAKARWV